MSAADTAATADAHDADARDAAATTALTTSCAQKACASDCPLEGAVRVEVGSELTAGVFYRKDTVAECDVQYNWYPEGRPSQIDFEPGCAYRHFKCLTPPLLVATVTFVTAGAEVWFAKYSQLAPVPRPLPFDLNKGDVVRAGEYLCFRLGSDISNARNCTIVLQDQATGKETAVNLDGYDVHLMHMDVKIVHYENRGSCRLIRGTSP